MPEQNQAQPRNVEGQFVTPDPQVEGQRAGVGVEGQQRPAPHPSF